MINHAAPTSRAKGGTVVRLVHAASRSSKKVIAEDDGIVYRPSIMRVRDSGGHGTNCINEQAELFSQPKGSDLRHTYRMTRHWYCRNCSNPGPPALAAQEEDVWMRVELHDASLVPAHLRPQPPPSKQPLGDSLRNALRSLSSSSGAVPGPNTVPKPNFN